jgi:hypothetical protein
MVGKSEIFEMLEILIYSSPSALLLCSTLDFLLALKLSLSLHETILQVYYKAVKGFGKVFFEIDGKLADTSL